MPTVDEAFGRRPRTPTRRRAVSSLLAALEALNPSQFRRIWEHAAAWVYERGEVKPRYLTCAGGNWFTLRAIASTAADSPHGAVPTTLRHFVVALWVQDHPDELVRPAWAPGLDIPGAVPL